MGKSKKTRWRTFEIDGSQDETQTNGADVKVNGTESSDSHTSVSSQKYSQILGDHHTNSSSHQVTSSRNSSSHHNNNNNNKSRGYNNKENFYNQRAGRLTSQRSWQRGGGGSLRTSIANKRPEETDKNGVGNGKVDSSAEPIKFNEDEYTRITTPRQDVLFKKGYLSQRNSNKTAPNLSATVNSTESTAASSTTTPSDPDSSVSTLSPATTPSMDYGQIDSMEYAPMYYPGYYDETGMLVIPMYNGYNYYPPSSGSAATSPVFLMPYPYQYDPFFMNPNGIQSVDGDENADDKIESDGAKENNQNAENQNGALSASSEDGEKSSSNTGDEKKDDETSGKKNEQAEQNGEANPDVIEPIDAANPDLKQNFPIYPNELNGSFMYPTYPNGFYNNFYYYNGASQPRPSKIRRRKRFPNSRNSHNNHQQQQPRSAETTTDYSDDEVSAINRRAGSRYQNGWVQHHNGYNQYNNNGRFHRYYYDHNANQPQSEFPLNVDVQEFYPRVHVPITQTDPTKVNCDAAISKDLERKDQPSATTAAAAVAKPKVEAPKVTKASHLTKPRVSKKEIIEGIKSMEQQNIDLMATKHQTVTNATPIDEWNVIKKGKKVKVVKDVMKSDTPSNEVGDDAAKKDKVEAEKKIETPKAEAVPVPEIKKSSTTLAAAAQGKSKKSKNKNKKKKTHQVVKQVGFEIIEPDFNTSPTVVEDEIQELSDEEEESTETEEKVLNEIVEDEIVAINVEASKATPEVTDLPKAIKKVVDDDAVIDISDEDIFRMSVLDISVVKEVERIIEMVNKPEVQGMKIPKIEFKEPEIVKKAEKKEVRACEVALVKKRDEQKAVQEPKIVKAKISEVLEVIKQEVDTPKESLKIKIPTKEPEQQRIKDELNQTKSEVLDQKKLEVLDQKKSEVLDQKKLEVTEQNTSKILDSIKPEVHDLKKPEVLEVKKSRVLESKKSEVQDQKKDKVQKSPEPEPALDPYQDSDYFNDRTNIAALERDLMENLRMFDDEFDLKSPIINPLYDFPITSAVRKWLQEKQNESFDSLFHVQNLKKLSELYDDDDEDDDENDETESDISEKELKSETDSDYASDFHAKANGGTSPTCSTHAKGSASKCNKLIAAKESFCALM